jgi:hypothetical protein
MQRSASTAGAGRGAGVRSAGVRTAGTAEFGAEHDSVVVHVQLRPRRGATRKCLAALAALAAEHEAVPFAVTGLSKDDRVVKVTVGIDLGPRAAVAKFSPQAQAAYAFVSAMFTSLYDHMPVYAAEPSAEERAAAVRLLDSDTSVAVSSVALSSVAVAAASLPGSPVPAPRAPHAVDRISA